MERIGGILRHAEPERQGAADYRGLVLLDRDGTLIRDVPFLHDPARVELMPGVGKGLAALQAAGFALAIVTNQQGIGLGYYSAQEMIAVNQQIFRSLSPRTECTLRRSTSARTPPPMSAPAASRRPG